MRSALRLSSPFALSFVLAACGSPEPPKAPESLAPPPPAPTAVVVTPAPAPVASTTTTTTTSSSTTTIESPPAPAAAPPVASGAKARPAKISARHVLVQWMGCSNAAPSVVRTRDQARAVAEEVLKRAKAGEDFGKLAVEFSDEPNAGQRGGSLGRFGHGMMVKPFEDAAFALEPGEISPIIETDFGFHVIQRTE